jgi:hypothetical protein
MRTHQEEDESTPFPVFVAIFVIGLGLWAYNSPPAAGANMPGTTTAVEKFKPTHPRKSSIRPVWDFMLEESIEAKLKQRRK